MDQKTIDNNFTYHPPKEKQLIKYNAIRNQAKYLAGMILDYCPDSRERSIAITNIEQCVFWANASIARNE